jgi:DNA-binding NarL/FixJ family response regulator
MVEHTVNTLNDDQIKILALLAVGTAEEKIAEQLCMSTQAVRVETAFYRRFFGQP